MDLLARLVGGEFQLIFFQAVADLAAEYNLRWQVDDEKFQSAHWAWEREILRRRDEGELDIRSSGFPIVLVGTLSKQMCVSDCVIYEIRNIIPEESEFSRTMSLLNTYPTEYVALEVARELHMEVYFARTNIPRIGSARGRITLTSIELGKILSRIRTDPDTIFRYPELLNLPTGWSD